jgi:glycosyltransferase involved in cell wall biosynthesis
VPYSESSPKRLRLLFLLPFVPRFDARHGGRTTAGLVARLAERHDAALICLRAEDEGPVDAVIRDRCMLVEEVRLPRPSAAGRAARLLWWLARGQPIEVSDSSSRDFTERIRALARNWRPDVVHLELERMVPHLTALGDSGTARVLVAMEAAGRTALDVKRAARGLQRMVRALDLRAWRRYESAALHQVDALICYTDRDRQALASVAPGLPIATIPLCVDVPQRPLDPVGASPPALLFVGGFGHLPNVDAAVRLATSIFPRIRPHCPEAILYLVGDKPPPRVMRLAGDDVIVTGRVDDVTPYLDRAAVVVAPLRLGGGTRVKVLEALASGKAVVASPLAAEGIEAIDGEHLILAGSDEELAKATTRLLADPDARGSLAAGAREWALTGLDWGTTVEAYEALYARTLTRRQDTFASSG